METPLATREQILDQAQGLVQTLGYDGFSFADVADRVGLRKASIHHHFATKADLGVGLVSRFRRDCSTRLLGIDPGLDPIVQLAGFVGLFRETLEAGRMCLCGVLAAGFAGLPEPVRSEVQTAVGEMELWLARTIEQGRTSGAFRITGSPESQARFLLAGLEGAMLLSRLHNDLDRFEEVARALIEALRTPDRLA